MNYFEQRERNFLKSKYELMYLHSGKPARAITANILKASREKLLSVGIEGTASPFCKNSIVLSNSDFKPGLHPYHHAGAYYVQEPSAAAAADVLDVKKGDYVLDMCAAPGGKSAQLCAALEGEGLLVSNEFVPSRAAVLKSNIQRMGFKNCVITNADTDILAKGYKGFFNKILADVPCSGEGMFYKEPQALAQHSEKLVLSCAALGARILDNAAELLCSGGELVYSTCTFSPQENEMQIGAFLKKHPEFDIIQINADFGSEGEKARCEEYNYKCNYTKRIYPCHKGEGHFIAKLRKNGEKAEQKRLYRKTEKTDDDFLYFIKEYFPLLSGACNYKAADNFYIAPNDMLPVYKGVNIVSQGVHAGKALKGRFQPEHALFMAFGSFCENKELLTLNDKRCDAFLRGEEIEALTAKSGYCAVMCDNLPLGFGKVSGGVIKNHYPKGLRNLK